MENHEHWFALPGEEALAEQRVDPEQGLSFDEAAHRLELVGYNELETAKGPTALQQFIGQFNDLIVWVLIAAALVSGPLLGQWIDAIAIIVIVFVNGALGFIQEYRAEQALQALKRLTAPAAQVIRGGRLHEIPARDVVPGDILVIETGNLIPADGRLLSAHNLFVDQALLAGEAAPAPKAAEAQVPPDVPLADRSTMVYSSTVVTLGRGRAVVTATGMRTELGRIAQLVQAIGHEETPLQQELERVGKYLLYAALAIVGLIFTLGVLRGDPILQMFLVAVSLAVAAIPEGLPAVVTIALALGVRRMAARHALVRRLRSVETLGAASVICTDKTGTLTENQMTVRRVMTPEREIQVTGEGYAPRGAFEIGGQPVPRHEPDLQAVLRAGVLSSTAELVHEDVGPDRHWVVRGDPTEGALLTAAAKGGYQAAEAEVQYELSEELPFDSERKRMSIVYRYRGNGEDPLASALPLAPGSQVAFAKGAPDVILPLCSRILRRGRVEELSSAGRESWLGTNAGLARQALRVLAMAYRPLPTDLPLSPETVERDLIFVGLEAMMDPPRAAARAAVLASRGAGINVIMTTGDHLATAAAIARDVDILHRGEIALSGPELANISDERLAEIAPQLRVVARATPEDKLRIVHAWQARGQVIAMTGDGVNDAPSLKEADIGIAMGIAGTDVSKEASDMILSDDNFATIVAAVEEGRTIFDNIRRFVLYLLSCNTGEVLTMFIAGLVGLPLPLLPIQILWINLTTDSLPALALGVEGPERGIMKRPPRPPQQGIVTRPMAIEIGWEGLLIGAVTLGAFVLELYALQGGAERARVLAFTTSILAQGVHAFNLRSLRQSLFTIGLFGNRWLIAAFLAIILANLAVIYVPFLQPIFDTVPLTAADWAVVVGLGLVPLFVVQAWRLVKEAASSHTR